MSNDCGSVDTEEYTQDEEVNCVFCGKLFPSIERVQEHISQCHESIDTSTENAEVKVECTKENKSLRIYDLNTELIINKSIDYNGVVQCSKCELLFVNAYASRMHFEKVHLGRKRKRSSNPNGVEGIIVSPNGTDNWGCDICGRQFPTLKQAKVHKFKSHIEPVQKKKMMLHRNILRKTNVSQRNYVKKFIAENKFREILPNSKKSKIDKSQIDDLPGEGCPTNDGDTSIHGDHNNHDSLAATEGIAGSRPAANIWRAAQASSRGNKIVISRVYQSELLLLPPGVERAKYGFLQKSGYSCFYCRETFLNKENFKRHLQLHRANKCYKCRNCGLKFKRVRVLKQHQRQSCHIEFIDNATAIVEPNGVPKQPARTTAREIHQVVKIESLAPRSVSVQQGIVDEEICARDIKFAEKFLNNSSITLNKGSQCVCNLCQSCFYSNNSILRHLVLYHRIAAQDGSTALATKGELSGHSRAKQCLVNGGPIAADASTKPSLHFIHNCHQCDSQFASKKGLQRHLQSVHNLMSEIIDDNKCLTGSESFNDPHRDECASWSSSSPGTQTRRLKCDVCGQRLANAETLEEHRRTHGHIVVPVHPIVSGGGGNKRVQGLGKVKSEQRVKLASRKSMAGYSVPAYKKAKVPPNSDGLFECDVCHKTFTCRSSLSNHVKSHFNFKNKPFSCSWCKQGFMSTLTLQHHREQLCPNMTTNNSASEPDNSEMCALKFEPQSLFSAFDGVSQVPSSGTGGHQHYGGGGGMDQGQPPVADSSNGQPYNGSNNGNLTTRATSCMHCSAMFPDRSLLEDHASKEHSNQAGEVVCIICPRSFTTYMAFRVHMTKSHGGPNGTSLKSHLNNTTSAITHKTNTSIDMIQDLSTSLTADHLVVHPINHGSMVLQSLQQQQQSSSPNGKLYQSRHACPNCDKDFSTSQALGNHKRACMPHLYKKVSL